MTKLNWKACSFDQLTTEQLFDIVKFRVDIFIVEQKCPYSELDDKDKHPETRHLTAYNHAGEVIAYSRILPPGLSYVDDVSLGRFAVRSDSRAQGIGSDLLQKSLQEVSATWPNTAIRISAQKHLTAFYEKENFESVSESYLEDGIPHIEMLRNL